MWLTLKLLNLIFLNSNIERYKKTTIRMSAQLPYTSRLKRKSNGQTILNTRDLKKINSEGKIRFRCLPGEQKHKLFSTGVDVAGQFECRPFISVNDEESNSYDSYNECDVRCRKISFLRRQGKLRATPSRASATSATAVATSLPAVSESFFGQQGLASASASASDTKSSSGEPNEEFSTLLVSLSLDKQDPTTTHKWLILSTIFGGIAQNKITPSNDTMTQVYALFTPEEKAGELFRGAVWFNFIKFLGSRTNVENIPVFLNFASLDRQYRLLNKTATTSSSDASRRPKPYKESFSPLLEIILKELLVNNLKIRIETLNTFVDSYLARNTTEQSFDYAFRIFLFKLYKSVIDKTPRSVFDDFSQKTYEILVRLMVSPENKDSIFEYSYVFDDDSFGMLEKTLPDTLQSFKARIESECVDKDTRQIFNNMFGSIQKSAKY